MPLEIHRAIRQQSAYPLPHSLILSFLEDYKRPNDKIHELLREKILTPIKKGLYIAGPSLEVSKPEPYVLANAIYGPSYVSLETALSYHGLIPERVFEMASMTTKASRKYSTPVGTFSYTKLPLPYYAFGIEQVRLGLQQRALMASAEKALCDKIVTTPGIIFRSQVQARHYVLEDLRIDISRLRLLDVKTMESWLENAPKRSSLQILLNVLTAL